MGSRGAPAELLMRIWQTDSRYCAQCYGRVYLAVGPDGTAVLLCPNLCEPGGHVSEMYVERAKLQDASHASEVAANYPDLARAGGRDDLIPDPAKLAASLEALYGAGAGANVNPNLGKRYDQLPTDYKAHIRAIWSQGE
ncbi:MAG: hypothetical protein MUP86_02230 [Dehalococcoidia bacterium]|nr:hypothetical protein [Dehalococcoidia bacterium]